MNAPVEIGDVLAGKYRIERVLGAGGMGVVVAATHLRLDQLVAIKFLLPSALESTEVVERFAREARAASKIQSEHVARVIDVGELESGSPYMVMEYLEGSDLSDILHAEARLPIARAVDYVLEACEALAEAHAAGIVHRDLKPANLYLANRADGVGIIKVLDFGISKATADPGGVSAARLTGTAVIMGSPLYMSPEQLRSSRDVDARSDVWALGIIFFELITGQTPFVGETVTEIIANIMTEDAPLASSLRDDVPPGLDDVVSLCLAKKRDKRYASVADFATELAPFGTPAAQQSADLIRRVLRVSLTARESASISAPTARLSGVETIRDPAPEVRPGAATDAPVSVGARTAVDGDRSSEGVLAQARAFGGDTAMSPTSLQGKPLEGVETLAAPVAMAEERPQPAPSAVVVRVETPSPKAGLPPAAWAIGAVALLGFGAVALSRGGTNENGHGGAVAAASGAVVALSAPTLSAQATAATASVPTISPAEPSTGLSAAASAVPSAGVAASAIAAASARPGGKALPGAPAAAKPSATPPAPPPATAAPTPPPPATTAPPAVVNPLDKLNKVQ